MSLKKKTKEEMITIAYELQNALLDSVGKRPVRIITNKDFSIIRIAWGRDYEKKEWHNQDKINEIIDKFKAEYSLDIREISIEEDKYNSVWLTKKEFDTQDKPESRKAPGAPKIRKR